MIPIRISLAGFLSYHEAQTLDFSDDSIWVLLGKNASGKSSIFDAILFALFDTPRAKGINNDDLINHQSDRAEIEFDFAIGSKLYRVNRNIEKKGDGTRQASTLRRLPDGTLDPVAIPGTHKKKEFDTWVRNELGLNLKTFTTSVLLRQGQADAFLTFSAEERYDVLEKLIDLSKYQALSEKANEHRKFWKAEAAARSADLDRITRVTDEDLDLAHRNIAVEDEACRASRQLEGRLVEWFGLANQWEQLQAGLKTLDGEIVSARQLLSNSGEIRSKYRQWDDLRDALPSLKSALDLANEIASLSEGIRQLMGNSQAAADPLEAAETRRKQLEAEYAAKQSEIQQLTLLSGAVANQLAQLAGTIRMINRIGELRASRDKHQRALDQFPANLDDRFRIAQVELLRLQEARQAAPWLGRLFGERRSLAEAEAYRADVVKRLGENKSKLPVLTGAKVAAQKEKDQANAEISICQSHLSDCKARREAAVRSLKNFNEVAGQSKCSYCGMNLDEEHKERELTRLTNALEEVEKQFNLAESQLETARKSQKVADKKLDDAAGILRLLETALDNGEGDLKRAEKSIRDKLQVMSGTYLAVPAALRTKVSPVEPIDVPSWLNTVYPTKADLDTVNADGQKVAGIQSEVDRLSKQIGDRGTERALLLKANSDLINEQAALPSDWETAQAENDRLSRLQLDLSRQLEAVQNEAGKNKDELDIAAGTYNRLHDEQLRRVSTIEANQGTLQRVQGNHYTLIASIPEKWRMQASTITAASYEALKAEMASLVNYETQYQLLSQAEQALSDLEKRARLARENIELIPEEARRPAAQVNKEMVTVKADGEEAKRRFAQAELRLHELEDRQGRYADAERASNEATRKAKLYEQLTDRLGEKGLQREIINKAELTIVRLSNQMLDNLSGGRSQLKLRDGDGSKKALDLEVYDRLTGAGQPLLVSLASGSQRFRIAISLALGIGQYIGHESHKIESVIIDEGFGSLDKEGRESVIQELYNLRNHLKRIILVSHQEEFSRGFTTGYEILLVDGSSKIRPLIQ